MSFMDEIKIASKKGTVQIRKEGITPSLRDKIKGLRGAAARFSDKAVRKLVFGSKAKMLVSEKERIEREICCDGCGENNGSCPYCGCKLKIKKWLSTESCPTKETYPHLKSLPERNYWQVCKEKTSVIIPVGKEKYTQKTIDNLFETATGDIEVIVVFDGTEPDIEPVDGVQVLTNKKRVGERVCFNQGARASTGKYLFRVDAHCIMSYGWDTKLKCACDDRTVVASVLDGIREEDWSVKGERYTFCSLNRELEPKWWLKYKKQPGRIEETMAFTGCGWMVQKDYWEKIKFNESYTKWGLIGTEVPLRTWLSGGRVLLRMDVFCAHLFRTVNPINVSTKEIEDTRQKLKDEFMDKIGPLIKKFNPPGWEAA